MSQKSKSPHCRTKRDKDGAPSVHFSEVFAEFGEAAYYQELLALGGGVYFFVFQYPRVAVGDEDRVETCGQGRIDVGLWAVADHPGGIVAAFVLLGDVRIDLGILLGYDLRRGEILLHS